MKRIYYLFMAAFFAPGLIYAQPANDNCSGALPIEVDGAAVIADNTEATIYGPHGSCFFDNTTGQVDGDVWFSITITEPTALLVTSEAGTTDDSQLALFTIEDCGGPDETFTEIACNDDLSFMVFMSEFLTDVLEPGTYYLRASTYGDEDSGDFSISVSSVTPPENDSCEGAIELEVDGPSEIADNSTATIVGPEGSCYGTAQVVGDTWFSFTITEEQNVRVYTEADVSDDSQVSVFTIEGCGTGDEVYTEVGCNDDSPDNYMSQVDMYNLPAGTYYIKAGTYSSFFTGSYSISLQSLADAPVGSDCSDVEAVELEVNGPTVSVSGTGTGAVDLDELGEPHVWEAFIITECADVTVDYCDMSPTVTNAFITLFETCPIETGSLVNAFAFDTTSCENLTISFIQLPAGTYYYPVMIPDGSNLDNYTINFTATTCTPEPDTCLYYAEGPWIDFNTIFEGAPVPDSEGVCETNQIVDFQVYASESYTIDGFLEDVAYTFSICDGGDAGAWSPVLSVTDPNGDLVAYEENCSISWVAEMSGTYVIGISEENACFTSDNTAVSNGFPSLTCDGTVGLNEVDNNANFSVFPNPNNGNFSIVNAGVSGNYVIELIDLTGRTVFAQNSVLGANSQTDVSVNGIAPGVYVLRMVNSQTHSFTTERIVVK